MIIPYVTAKRPLKRHAHTNHRRLSAVGGGYEACFDGVPALSPLVQVGMISLAMRYGYDRSLTLPHPTLAPDGSLPKRRLPCEPPRRPPIPSAILEHIFLRCPTGNSSSRLHSIPIRRTILPLLVICRDPQHVVASDQDLAEHALVLAVDPLDGAAELDVHVAVDADQAAGVLGLAPLEANAHVGVDERLQHWPRVHGDELCEKEE